ncbi:pyridoxal phosphate-dependent aminotransferase [Campylobacter sp. MIT 19-121]|uniref:pyridoxal phosphate-dependent aminotransferase n=1 Tax=Campylobacter sp. MIT 19-121 TaxID=2703906 RepID=UPI001EE42098|nr:histidinol-phosphate transaminase [Campylobacter sp. MIT 19-121]
MKANKNIQELSPYVSIPHKVWDIENKKGVLKLDWNEATIPPSPKVFQAIQSFLKDNFLNWYPNTNNISLLESLAKYCRVSIENIQTFASSDAAHEFILSVFLENSDKIAIISPTYDNFRARAQGIGIKTLPFMLDADFELNFELLNKFIITNNIKCVYICNPNNPTGKAYDKEKLTKLLQDFEQVLFIIDEAYYEFYGTSMQDLVQQYKNIIITRTFSKAFALAGLRIGYVISHSENILALNKLRNPKNVNALAQVAAIAALNDLEYTQNYINEVKLARKEFITSMDLVMGGGACPWIRN